MFNKKNEKKKTIFDILFFNEVESAKKRKWKPCLREQYDIVKIFHWEEIFEKKQIGSRKFHVNMILLD